jgi:acetylornithine deacetylase
MKAVAIDRQFLTETLADLVRINSINPGRGPGELGRSGGPGEAEIARYLERSIQKIGLEVRAHEPEPGRVSVVGKLPGRGEGKSLMLNAHTDTVGVEGMDDPFSARVCDGRLYGRGSQDMKGGLAAALAAAKALVDSQVVLQGDLLIAAVADEEQASLGTADLIPRYRVDGAIVCEPTDLEICLAHKGFVWFEIATKGRAAHGSRFDEGIDANMQMGRFLADLDRLEQELRQRPGHTLTGPPSLHAAMIEGGSAWSVYATHCRLRVERRTTPGETAAQAAAELQAIIDRLSASDRLFQAHLKEVFQRDPFEVAPDLSIVQSLDRAATKVLGQKPGNRGQTFWTDAALLAAAGIETVVLGPTGAGLHRSQEWVELDSVFDLAQILAQTALDFCGSS